MLYHEGSRRGGLTLLELLVSMSLLFVVAALAAYFYSLTLRTSRGVDARDQAYRQGLLAVRKMRLSLRGGRLVSTSPYEVVFDVPQVDEGRLIVDAAGLPLYGAQRRIYSQDGMLLQSDSGSGLSRLARLGPEGSVRFETSPEGMLEVTVAVYGPETHRNLIKTVLLQPNP